MARKPGLRLSDAQILAIFLSMGPQKVVAGEYGIHRSMVSRIRRGWYRPDLTEGVSLNQHAKAQHAGSVGRIDALGPHIVIKCRAGT